MANDLIEILLATYNGEKYLSDQLYSIIEQSFDNWKILIRDDGSKDCTLEIINKFKNSYPKKIFMINDRKKNLGVCGNFSELLRNSNSDYIMFCDQDDIWLKNKIKITFDRMKELEKTFGSEFPILVHTDLIVVNSKLEKLSDSFWRYAHFNPASGKKFARLLNQNIVTGCTIMINRALKNLSPFIPNDAVCHDWWFALVSCAFGIIETIPIPAILYRQHHANIMGARRWSNLSFLFNFIKTINQNKKLLNLEEQIHEVRQGQKKLYNQAICFYNYYFNKLNENQSILLSTFAELDCYNFMNRRLKLLKYGFFKPGFARNLRLFLFV
jgi:glycosyltransferase involved in cell wall biosynthesis